MIALLVLRRIVSYLIAKNILKNFYIVIVALILFKIFSIQELEVGFIYLLLPN